jgi:hypothetical protein
VLREAAALNRSVGELCELNDELCVGIDGQLRIYEEALHLIADYEKAGLTATILRSLSAAPMITISSNATRNVGACATVSLVLLRFKLRPIRCRLER